MREEFEKWISSPPYEKRTKRYPDDAERYAWPGNYLDVNVELAWQAWQSSQESIKTPCERCNGTGRMLIAVADTRIKCDQCQA